MTRRPSVFARSVPFARAFLLALALEPSGIQVQAVTVAALRQTLHRPLGPGIEPTMHVAPAKTAEEIAEGVINRKAGQAEPGTQGPIPAYPVGVRQTFGPRRETR
jgi:hypothetical protein